MTVTQNVMIGAFCRYRRRRDAERSAREVLDRIELGHLADVLASALSLGQRKRLEVARALAIAPRILLLDEVMAGLNPAEVDRAIALIRKLHTDGLTIVLIEHNLKVVRSLAQRVLVLDHGTMIAEGTPADVLANPAVVEAYVGTRRR
jgi:branched-chain amino acid transport system ATP-binding protein